MVPVYTWANYNDLGLPVYQGLLGMHSTWATHVIRCTVLLWCGQNTLRKDVLNGKLCLQRWGLHCWNKSIHKLWPWQVILGCIWPAGHLAPRPLGTRCNSARPPFLTNRSANLCSGNIWSHSTCARRWHSRHTTWRPHKCYLPGGERWPTGRCIRCESGMGVGTGCCWPRVGSTIAGFFHIRVCYVRCGECSWQLVWFVVFFASSDFSVCFGISNSTDTASSVCTVFYRCVGGFISAITDWRSSGWANYNDLRSPEMVV